jgi:hypothetical protein
MVYVFLRELAELEFKFFGRVNTLLDQKRIHCVDRCTETVIP